jgi:hypothetical protein
MTAPGERVRRGGAEYGGRPPLRAFLAGTAPAPRPTRQLTALFTAVAGADWPHIGYARARERLHG